MAKNRIYWVVVMLVLFCFGKAFAQPAVGSWTDCGPVPFPTNVSGQVNGMGRVCQVKFHPSNPMKMYAVSASGGLYMTTDNGVHWTPAPGTEQMPQTACASVCIDYTDDNILYLSTGDPNYYGDNYGIWKSTDGGTTFNPANTGVGNRMAVELIMDPNNHLNIIAATDDGIWRTTDGGATWTERVTGGQFRSMKQRPGSANVLYAVTDSSYFRSSDMGITWSRITSGITIPYMNGGLRLAVSAADTNVVYIATTDSLGLVMKSTDGGATFSTVCSSNTQCIVCYDSTPTSGSQGNYNFSLTANPANANELLLVSHCVWRSTDGGYTWSWRTQWYDQVHTDMHDIEFNPYNLNQRFNANDGGVWLSTDTLATAWTPRCDGLAATEVYHAAQSPVVRQLVSIGTQDNGELYYDGAWKTNRGGDWSAKCAIDYLGTGAVYYDDGNRRNLSPLGGDNPYNAPFPGGPSTFNIEFLPTLSNEAFIGTTNIWRSTDINTASPSWTMIGAIGENITAMASCRADNNILYAVTDNNHLLRSDNAQSATPTFVTIATPAATNIMASIATDRHNANVVYLSCNNAIYRSANKGVSWANITGALPGLNILKIISDDYSTTERIFVSEGSYVYYKDNATAWTNTAGLPSIPQYTDFMIYNDSTSASILRASTYGRGVWQCNIFNNLPPSGSFASDKQYLCPGDTVRYYKNMYGNFTSFSWSFPGGVPATSVADSPIVVYPMVGSYAATLTIYGTPTNDTVTIPAYITVSNGSPGMAPEGFEETFFPPTPQWTQLTQSGQNWQQTGACGGFGASAHSMYFDNFDNDGGGHHDRILTPKLDLTTATSAYMTFDVAYAYYSGYHDSLMVEVSTDCGRTFTSVYEKDTSVLATAPDTSGSFVPGALEWRTDTVFLNAYLGSAIQIAFDNIGHYGQNLYIDNINLNIINPALGTGIVKNGGIEIYPNPARDMITIKAPDVNPCSVTISCYNDMGVLSGRKITRVTSGGLNTTFSMAALKPGVYEILVQCDDGHRYVEEVRKEK